MMDCWCACPPLRHLGCTACAGLGRGRFSRSMGTLGRPAVRRAPPKARACLNRGPLCAMAVGGVGPTVGRMRAPRIGRGHRTARRHYCPSQKLPKVTLDLWPSTCAGALPVGAPTLLPAICGGSATAACAGRAQATPAGKRSRPGIASSSTPSLTTPATGGGGSDVKRARGAALPPRTPLEPPAAASRPCAPVFSRAPTC